MRPVAPVNMDAADLWSQGGWVGEGRGGFGAAETGRGMCGGHRFHVLVDRLHDMLHRLVEQIDWLCFALLARQFLKYLAHSVVTL